MAKKKLVQPSQIITFTQTTYKDCPVLVECLGTIFWYRFCYENKLYGSHIQLKPRKSELDKNEIFRGAVYMLDMAMATIDHLRGDDPDEQEQEHKAVADIFIEAITKDEDGKQE